MSEYIFGAHILESLTRGMYSDSKTIFREYVQNSCDAIDAALSAGIIRDGEGRIDINLDTEKRKIVITDNGTGIKADDFRRVLGNVADSDKKQGEERGFRGIGRLCGLAYCETLKFTAKFKGEDKISTLTCNGKILHDFLIDRDSGIKRLTASEVLNFINEFTEENADDEDIDAHYFIVELDGINAENTDLLNFDMVKNYLSFTAPLPYSMTFSAFRAKIHEHAEKLGMKIEEYDIFLNDEQLFKQYTMKFKTGRGKGEDEIFDVSFEDFRDINNNLTAWLWFGMSSFKGAIEERCLMRGFRVRSKNIQVGDGRTLQKFFGESRGINYFVGELFCVSKDLVLNSQRDYFSENSSRVELENQLRNFFRELSRMYHDGSQVNSTIRKLDEAEKRKAEIHNGLEQGIFVTDQDRQKAEEEFNTADAEAINARKAIDRMKNSGSNATKIIIRHIEERDRTEPNSTEIQPVTSSNNFTYKQRILTKVFYVIKASVDSATADFLIDRIQDAL